jgi:tetratricopeptide (TPR) repeat protein
MKDGPDASKSWAPKRRAFRQLQRSSAPKSYRLEKAEEEIFMPARSVLSLLIAPLLTAGLAFSQWTAEGRFPPPVPGSLAGDQGSLGPGLTPQGSIREYDTLAALPVVRPPEQHPVADTVSLFQLQHRVPRKARSEYSKAVKLAPKHLNIAIMHWKKAVAIDPQYLDALNCLGVAYLVQGDTAIAAAYFRKMIDTDPQSYAGYVNLTVALLAQCDYTGAERSAREATNVRRGEGLRDRYLLGVSLVMQEKYTPEAVRNLEGIRAEVPPARVFLARALAGTGRLTEAISELQQYLEGKSPDADLRKLANKWLDILNKKQAVLGEQASLTSR